MTLYVQQAYVYIKVSESQIIYIYRIGLSFIGPLLSKFSALWWLDELNDDLRNQQQYCVTNGSSVF